MPSDAAALVLARVDHSPSSSPPSTSQSQSSSQSSSTVAATSPTPTDSFKWTEIESGTRPWLKSQTEQIQSLYYRTACDLVRMGQLLREIHGRLPAGTFSRWVESELPWSRQYAYKLMSVGEAFGPFVSHKATERISPAALYLLASPSVHVDAREYAAELATVRIVTKQDAREILDQYKPVPEVTRKEMRELDKSKRRVGIDEKPSLPELPEPTMKELAWDALEALVSDCDAVHITRMDDAEPYPDEQVPASVTCLPGEGKGRPRNDVGSRLMDVVLRMAGREMKKKCLGKCKKTLPLSQFSLCKKSTTDGRNRYCLKCERSRVKQYDLEKQAKKNAENGATAATVSA